MFPLHLCWIRIILRAVQFPKVSFCPCNMLKYFSLAYYTLAYYILCPCMPIRWLRTNLFLEYHRSSSSWMTFPRWKCCVQTDSARCLAPSNLNRIPLVLLLTVGATVAMTHYLLLAEKRRWRRRDHFSWAPYWGWRTWETSCIACSCRFLSDYVCSTRGAWILVWHLWGQRIWLWSRISRRWSCPDSSWL